MARFLNIGSNRVDVEKVQLALAIKPTDEQISGFYDQIRSLVIGGANLPEALLQYQLDSSEHWITVLLAIADYRYQYRYQYEFPNERDSVESFARRELSGVFEEALSEEESSEFLDPLVDSFGDFFEKVLLPCEKQFFFIGSSWVRRDEVIKHSAPTDSQAAFCWENLAQTTANGVAILQGYRLVGSTVSHPWLIMAMSVSRKYVDEGRTPSEALEELLSEYVGAYDTPPVDDSLVDDSSKYLLSSENDNQLQAEECYDSNMLTWFQNAIFLIKIGEEIGILDKALLKLASIHKSETSRKEKLISSDLFFLLDIFSFLRANDIPLLKSLKLLREESRFEMFKDDLTKICDEIEGGLSLSEAFATAKKPFSSKILLGLLRIGESSGTLKEVLARVIYSDIEF